MTIVSNCGHDENWSYRNGVTGDQTGEEWCLYGFFYFGQNVVLRYVGDQRVPALIGEYAEAAAFNDNIGYDQYQRLTFWYALEEYGYNPAAIALPCETDCSAGVAAIVKAVGYMLGIPELAMVDESAWTGSLKDELIAAGFVAIYDEDMLVNGVGLLTGDIQLNEAQHVNIVTESDYDINYGEQVEEDGYWGKQTTFALQQYIGTTPDGIVSHQHIQCKQPGFTTGWEYDASYLGSELIRAIQTWLREYDYYNAHIDGLCGSQTIKGLQRMCGTEVDGEISAPSDCVREIQHRLNEGTLFR